MTVEIFDQKGARKDWAWLQSKFGKVTYQESTYTQAYRLVEIRESNVHGVLIASLRDDDGAPIGDIEVIRHWHNMDPKKFTLPEWAPPPKRYFDTGVHGKSNAEGNIGFGTGSGDYYNPQTQTGASSIWVGHLDYGSDCISGLGEIIHPEDGDLHLNCVFQRMESAPPPPPPPEIEAELQKIEAAVAAIREIVG